jgi:hypothetical protein
MNEEYNGWSNYATWRVYLEILGDIEFDSPVNVDQLKEIVEEYIFRNFDTCDIPYLIEDYARAFLNQVNYYEISKTINEEITIAN